MHMTVERLVFTAAKIIVGVDATAQQIKRLRQAGADDYLAKPLNSKKFLDASRGALLVRNRTACAGTARKLRDTFAKTHQSSRGDGAVISVWQGGCST